MKRITKISIIAVGALVVASSFTACSHFRSPESRAQWVVEKVTDKLELTESQQIKLTALRDEVMNSRKDMRQKFGESKSQFKTLLDASTLDQKQAVSLVGSHTQFVNEQAPVLVAAFANFYDSLDLEQQAEIREFVGEHDERHHRWGSHRFFSHN